MGCGCILPRVPAMIVMIVWTGRQRRDSPTTRRCRSSSTGWTGSWPRASPTTRPGTSMASRALVRPDAPRFVFLNHCAYKCESRPHKTGPAQTFFTLEEDCKTIMEHSRIWQPVASETRPHDESDHQYQMILEQMVENCDAEEYNAQTGEWTATAEIVRHSLPAHFSSRSRLGVPSFSPAPPRAGRRALRERSVS